MTEPEIPDELAAALAGDHDARFAFERLAPSHRREYGRWVADATREDTRRRRAEKAVALLRDGRAPR